jgi:hypothetical protein
MQAIFMTAAAPARRLASLLLLLGAIVSAPAFAQPSPTPAAKGDRFAASRSTRAARAATRSTRTTSARSTAASSAARRAASRTTPTRRP